MDSGSLSSVNGSMDLTKRSETVIHSYRSGSTRYRRAWIGEDGEERMGPDRVQNSVIRVERTGQDSVGQSRTKLKRTEQSRTEWDEKE